jgi:hypothetical protein
MRGDVETNPAAFHEIAFERRRVSLGDAVMVYTALVTRSTEMWTTDPLLLSFSGRASVRGLKICEPHTLVNQPSLDL